MGAADGGRVAVRGPGLSSQCLQEKKALVAAVSVAVEAILAQFGSSRTAVQKALSGDSTVNPSLGRLVLQCLCPALHSLLTDGLKPHQSDVISGRRPNTAWSVVQASTRPGPKTQALFNLQVRVGDLPQLRQSRQRFNSFLLGLLNSKLLDSWLSHLLSCSDVLETFYSPASFLRLSLGELQPFFQELLLVVQPLSLLTFNLDLLFQHHRLHSAHTLRPPPPSPPTSTTLPPPPAKLAPSGRHVDSLADVDFGKAGNQAGKDADSSLPELKDGGWADQSLATPIKPAVTVERTSPQLLWVQEKEMVGLLPPNIQEESLAQQAGQVIQQGWGAVMRWGGRLSLGLSELSHTATRKQEAELTELQELPGRPQSDYTAVSSGPAVPWGLQRLFGASKSPNSPTGPLPPTRRPSQWLAPGVTALTRMVSSNSAPMLRRVLEREEGKEVEEEKEKEKEGEEVEMKEQPRPLRSVRTLCDHAGTGAELSFSKGEELVVLGGVDQDWIRCRKGGGGGEGLVAIGYTSLIM